MTSLDVLRQEALTAVRETDWSDPTDRFCTESYLATYNSAVPFDYQIGRSAVLTAELGAGEATSRVASHAVRDLEEAVAFMVKEISRPGSAPRLTAQDYERAGLVQSVHGNVVMLAPSRRQVSEDLFEGLSVPTATETAFERLVALVPSGTEDVLDLDALLSTRSTSRRAIGKVLESAVRSGGLSLSVAGVAEPQRAALTSVAAQELVAELAIADEVTEQRTVIGMLEGARTVRRRFYLIPAHRGPEIWGSIDEDVISEVARLVGQSVIADLQVTRTIARSGRPSRQTYRLSRIAPAPDQPGFFG